MADSCRRPESRLVLVGAGHAHLEVLRRLGERRPEGLAVTLVTPDAATPYSGMLPGVIAGHYAPEALLIPVAPLVARAGAAVRYDVVTGLDPSSRRLRLAGGGAMDFDVVSLDVGAGPDAAGAPRSVLPIKPIAAFLEGLAAAETSLGPGARVEVVGAGVGGAEVVLALAHRWRGRGIGLTLVERGPMIVPGLPDRSRRLLEAAAGRAGVVLRTGATADAAADLSIWTTGAVPAPWLAACGLATEDRGFVRVEPSLRAVAHPAVFAAGDVAVVEDAVRPRAGVFAVRQGPVLTDNLLRAIAGETLRPWRAQRRWLNLIATGPRHAIATRNGITLSGGWVWTWKDRIDRRFVTRYKVAG
jgi:selenide,water dikinase